MSTTISEQTVYNLLVSALDNKSIDKSLFVKAVMKACNGSSRMEYLLHLLHNKGSIITKQGDYFTTIAPKYHQGDKFNYDTLKDLGLCTDDYEVYGKIVNDEGWGNDYDPFYGRVKTILFYHDTDGKMKHYDETINTSSLNIINKSQISYFKSLTHGKDLKRTPKKRNQGLENLEEITTQTSS